MDFFVDGVIYLLPSNENVRMKIKSVGRVIWAMGNMNDGQHEQWISYVRGSKMCHTYTQFFQ